MCGQGLHYGQAWTRDNPLTAWVFCKVDYIESYLSQCVDGGLPIVLVTGCSDFPVDEAMADRVFSRFNIRHWFTTNPTTTRPRVTPIPLGVGNEGMSVSGNPTYQLRHVMEQRYQKTEIFNARFSVATAPRQRGAALKSLGLNGEQHRVPFKRYLAEVAQSYFSIAPRGTGVDTHRAWEALYLRTVPVVERSLLWDRHSDMPVVIVDDWADFDPSILTPDLYAYLTAGFDWDSLYAYRYMDRMKALL